MTTLGPNQSGTISFHVTNLSAADAQFLSTVIAVFCDPDQASQARLVRAGDCLIHYGPDGKAYFADIVRTPPTAAAVIEFVARFNDDEWQDIIRSVTHFRQIMERSLEDAEAIARRCLGYLPKPVSLQPVNQG